MAGRLPPAPDADTHGFGNGPERLAMEKASNINEILYLTI